MGKQVKVVATAKGHDGKKVREEGEEFTVDEDVFKPRMRELFNAMGEKVGEQRYPDPSWFKRVDGAKAAPAGEPKTDKSAGSSAGNTALTGGDTNKGGTDLA